MDNTGKLVGQRINAALALRDVKQKELAEHLDVTPNTISYFTSGARMPNTRQIISIAKHLGVSLDYLAGRHDTSSPDIDVQAIVEKTGLEPKAVEKLVKWKEWMGAGELSPLDEETVCIRTKTVSFLIEHEEVVPKGENEVIGFLSYLHCRLFGNLFLPLLRSDEDAEKKFHEQLLALKESKGRDLTAEEEIEEIFKTFDYGMVMRSIPLMLSGENKRLHRVGLGGAELNKIYDSIIVESLSKLRDIAEQEDENNASKKK